MNMAMAQQVQYSQQVQYPQQQPPQSAQWSQQNQQLPQQAQWNQPSQQYQQSQQNQQNQQPTQQTQWDQQSQQDQQNAQNAQNTQNQQPQVSTQIAVYKTNKKLLEVLDKLNPATATEYAHIHGAGDDGNGGMVYSLLGLVLLDYSNGTGSSTICATANLAPEDVAFLFAQIRQGKEAVDFSQEKIFGTVDGIANSGMVTKVLIKRSTVGSDGKPRNYPWYIEIQNGIGIKGKAATGGTYIQANSFQAEKKVYLNLNDQDMYKIFHKVMRYVEVWEMAYGTELLKCAIKLRRQNQQ